MREIENIFIEYRKKLNELNKRNPYFSVVFNNENLEKDFSKIKAIVVMDNPGKEEKEQSKYLVGPAGKSFDKVWEKIGLKRNEVLIFNKSSIFTPSTNDLNKLYLNEKTKTLFLEEQKITFRFIMEIQEILNVPILIHGYSQYIKNNTLYIQNEKSNRPLFMFFKLLKEEKNIEKNIYFYKHSSYGNLSKQVTKYMERHKLKKITFKEYLNLGKEISTLFFQSKDN